MLRERNEGFKTIKFVDISSDDYSPEDNQGLDYETVCSPSNYCRCLCIFIWFWNLIVLCHVSIKFSNPFFVVLLIIFLHEPRLSKSVVHI